MDMTVSENNGTVTMCLMKNITTDGPITVVFDAEEESGVSNPASGEYHTVYRSFLYVVRCISIRTHTIAPYP